MNALSSAFPRLIQTVIVSVFLIAAAAPGYSQTPVTTDPPFYGPYNAIFLPDGDGLRKPLLKEDSILHADSPWSIYAWVEPAVAPNASTLIAGVGDPVEEFPRYLALENGRVVLWIGKENSLSPTVSLIPGKWHFLAATFDGQEFHLYSDGTQIASGKLDTGSVSPTLNMAPLALPATNWEHFGGTIEELTLQRRALTPDEVKQLAQSREDIPVIEFEDGSKSWPVQTRGQAG